MRMAARTRYRSYGLPYAYTIGTALDARAPFWSRGAKNPTFLLAFIKIELLQQDIRNYAQKPLKSRSKAAQRTTIKNRIPQKGSKFAIANSLQRSFEISTKTIMKKELKVEDFSASLFWDVDKSKVDFEKNAVHVVEKTLNRGSWEDFQLALAYYGRERTKEIVRNIRYFDRRTERFCSVYFEIPLTEMRCYVWRQSNPSYWDY
jgi:hypothetical protein